MWSVVLAPADVRADAGTDVPSGVTAAATAAKLPTRRVIVGATPLKGNVSTSLDGAEEHNSDP